MAPIAPERIGVGRSVLLVDDHAANRALLNEYLTGLGFETIEAADGATAIDLARLHRPDLALIDLVMPVLDGFETIRRLRALDTAGAMRIVAVSASAFDTDRLASLSCGSDAFLAKPLDLTRLTDTIYSLLGLDRIRADSAPVTPIEGSRIGAEALAELSRAVALGDVTAIGTWLEKEWRNAPGDPLLTRIKNHLKRFDVRAIQSEMSSSERFK